MKKTVRQNISHYTVVFTSDEEGFYHVSVPVLPGCVTFGSSFQEAQEKAQEVIELWLEELAGEKQPLPQETKRPWIGDIAVKVPKLKSYSV
ncbi:MAG: type II toxin-antitoxin system HicB family antitoxin [bacterium]|nr:type II toxin-antitoxin system HicB family antitoxin [bacterium]